MKAWKIEVESIGRSGVAKYFEGSDVISFDLEIGGGETVAVITGPPPQQWAEKHSWAVSQKAEIMNRVATEVVRQKAKNCIADIHEQSHIIYINHKSRANQKMKADD